ASSAVAGDFVAAARPLWLVCVALGLVVAVLGFVSTSPRAVDSARRLVPLVEGRKAVVDD
ncbi:MAG: MFS transporter, partial [Mycobacterium sp.]